MNTLLKWHLQHVLVQVYHPQGEQNAILKPAATEK